MQIGRVIFGARERSAPTRDPVFDAVMHQMIEAAKMKHFREGMTEGVIMALEALLGIAAKGTTGTAWEGELPADLRMWIEDALERAKAQRARS